MGKGASGGTGRHTKTSSPGKGFADIGGDQTIKIVACAAVVPACNRLYILRYVEARLPNRSSESLVAKALAPQAAGCMSCRFPPDFDLFSRLRLMFASAFLDNS